VKAFKVYEQLSSSLLEEEERGRVDRDRAAAIHIAVSGASPVPPCLL
jgi:hypothetical protein